jgi:SAM-dependent methyltransferase
MRRVPEAELMLDADQARAYALADFAEPHARFVTLFGDCHPRAAPRRVLDLGCGTGDVLVRYARAFPASHVVGVDAARAMLAHARAAVAGAGLDGRVSLVQAYLPHLPLALDRVDTVISNSLLHHLAAPAVLWNVLAPLAGTRIFVMDLLRPASPGRARRLVENYAGDADARLRHDFFSSLLAAYTVTEVRRQLRRAGLDGLLVEAVSDRHWVVYGSIR